MSAPAAFVMAKLMLPETEAEPAETIAAQPIEEISRIVHDAGSLLLVDTVTSLGGMPVRVDEWHVDACYSGTQKCLSCPPGLSPVTFGEAAVDAIANRKTKVPSWYLDMTMVRQYWGSERLYHHTAPISMNYALHEALRDTQSSMSRSNRDYRSLGSPTWPTPRTSCRC